MIKKISVPTILIVKTKTLLNSIDIKKYNSQYNNLKIIKADKYHDRYIIIDKKLVYHCGASLNYAGSKTFSINKLQDEMTINAIINKVYQNI